MTALLGSLQGINEGVIGLQLTEFLQGQLVCFSSFTPSFLESLTKSRNSLIDGVKSSFLGWNSEPVDASGVGAATLAVAGSTLDTVVSRGKVLKGETSSREVNRASFKEAFPGVFVILDRFPAGNQVASLQSMAEIGALFPDVMTLDEFHQTESERSYVSNIHQHLCDVQLRLVQQLSPNAALDVYKAFAVLRFQPAAEVHEALFTTVAENAETLELPDITNFLQARLMLQPAVDDATSATLSTVLSMALKRSKKRNLKESAYVVRMLCLFVDHNLRDEDVLSDAVEYLRARVKGLSTEHLVSVVAAMTSLKYPAGKLFDGIVVEVLHRGPDSFSTAELARLAAALTETKHCDVMTDVLMDSIAVTCRKRMNQLKFDELGTPHIVPLLSDHHGNVLVDLLWAYAHHMHFHHDAKLQECLATGLVARLDSVNQISSSMCLKLCEVVSASDLGPDNSCLILEAISSRLPTVIGEFDKEKLLTVATGCRKTGFVCVQLLGTIKDAFEMRAEELSLPDLCRVLNNFASLDFHPGNRLLELALQNTNDTGDLSPTEVSRLIWSLAYFNKLTSVNSRQLFDHLQNFSRSNFSALDTQKLLLSEKLILLQNKDEDQTHEDEEGLIPKQLRSELTTMWRERIYFTRSVSPFQQEVSRMLTKMNVDHEAEALIDNGDLSVDFLLFLGSTRSENEDDEMAAGSKVVLECDGPRRYSVNAPYRPLGQTLSFKKLLKAQGWKTVVISKEDWRKKSPLEQEHLLKKRLKLQ